MAQQRTRKTPDAAAGPASPKTTVVNAANETLREIQLSPEVFGVRVSGHLLYEAVKQHRAGGRRGTHMTKNRALVSGCGTGGRYSGRSPATTRTRCPRRRGRLPCAEL